MSQEEKAEETSSKPKSPMSFSPMTFKPMDFDHVLQEDRPNEKVESPTKLPTTSREAPIGILMPKQISIPLSADPPASVPVCKVPFPLNHAEPEAVQKPSRATPYEVARSLIRRGLVISAAKLLYFYDGRSFQPCRREEAEKKIVEHCRDAVAAEGRPSFARQVYQMLLQEPEICRDDQLHLNTVAFGDCLLNLDTLATQPHSPSIFVTTQLRASWYKGNREDCPRFKEFLDAVSNHDPVLKRRIWQVIGYLLAPDQTGKAFFLFQGVPNSGKSVLGNLIRNCFAGDVVSALDINEMSGEFALSDLVGKKLCVDFDLPADPFSKRAVSKLKKLTGGDPTSSNVKYSDRVKFVNTAKLLFATNHAAIIPNQDEAFFDRMVVIPFTVPIHRTKQDRQLPQKLELERDAIVVQALNAYRKLADSGYVFAGDYLPNATILGMENPADAAAQFLAESCEYLPGCWTSTEQLYSAFACRYGSICGKNEFSKLAFQLSSTIYPQVERRRNRITSTSNPTYGFAGLKLKEEIV